MNQTNSHSTDLAAQLRGELYSKYSHPVTDEWLSGFLSTVKTPVPPLPVLTSTAHFRLLNSDITRTLLIPKNPQQQQSMPTISPLVFPSDIANVNTKSDTLRTNVPVQILSVEDIGSSKWSQFEAIERFEKGEEVRGREIIRNVPSMNEGGYDSNSNNNNNNNNNNNTNTTSSTKRSSGPHKVLVQDAAGTKVFAFELGTVPKLFITNTSEEGGVDIGCKLLLKKGCVIRRGMIMLRAEYVELRGGRVEEWDKAWRKGRKERLKEELEQERARMAEKE